MADNQRNGFLGSFGRFFFLPTDPTTLGFMRIMTGLLLLYTHAAYSLDLQTFMGPHAWWDHQAANSQRREAPHVPTPLGWSSFEPTFHLMDDAPHRRNTIVEFLRKLPESPEQREAKLRYLGRLFALSPQDIRDGLFLSNSAGLLFDTQGAKIREALAADVVPESGTPITIPNFVRALTPEERLAVWDEVLAFNSTLPSTTEEREYIFTWLGNYPPQRRMKLYEFMVGTRMVDGENMSLPAGKSEREEFLDYENRWGVDPRQAAGRGTAVFSQWYHLKNPTTMWVVHLCCLFVFLLFTIGIWTRVVSVLAWAISVAYIQRGQVSLFGQDTMQTILVTYLMIGPSGAALSIDALRKRFRAARTLMSPGGTAVPWAESALAGPRRDWLANFSIRLFQLNFCLIYASSGVSKLKGNTWWEHSASWLVLSNPEFGLVRYQAYEWVLRQVAESRFIVAVMAAIITGMTLTVELGLPVIVWTRMRPYIVMGSIMLHLGIAIIMGLSVFSLYMFTMVLCYFPAKLIRDRVAYGPGMGRKMTAHYDARSKQAVRKAALMRSLDVANQITFVNTPATGEIDPTVHLTNPTGTRVSGQELYTTSLKELVLLKPIRIFGYIPGVWALINGWFGR